MSEQNLTIKPGEQPPTQEYIESRHRALTTRWRVTNYVTNVSACVALAGLAVLTLSRVHNAPGYVVAEVAYGLGLVGALFGRQCMRTAEMHRAEVNLAGDGLLGETAALANDFETAREYMAGVRAQGRQIAVAEVSSLRE